MTNAYLLLGAPEEAIATGTRALEIAARLSDLRLRILTTSFLEQGHYHRGEYGQVIELATDNLAALPAEWANENLCGTAPSAILDRYFLVMSLAYLGRFVDAGEHAIELLRMAEATYLPFGLACEATGTLHLLEGDWANARSWLEDGIAAVKTGNIVNMTNRMIALSAWAFAQLGERSEALNRLDEGKQLLDRQAMQGHLGLLGWSYYVLGRACLTLGRLDEAKRFGDRALEFSPHHPGFAAHGLHLLGTIAAHPERFDLESGKARFYRALALADPRGMRPLVAHCHRGLATLYLRNREIRKSQEHLAKATAMYRDMGFRKLCPIDTPLSENQNMIVLAP
jgi:tetratricopeptide (TPR) repeat protein